MNKPTKSKAKVLVQRARSYVGHSKTAIRRNCWDRDWTLEMVLEIAERLRTMGEDRLVLNVLDIYEEIQNLKYTGPMFDKREYDREMLRKKKETSLLNQ